MTNNKRNAKKQQRENRTVNSAEETPGPSVSPAVQAPTDPETPVEKTDPLMAEVESFLSRRDELAQKIAEEIEATELKLAELKKTAALLFPDAAGNSPPSQKAKKPKAKPSAKSEPSGSGENASATE